MKKVLLSLISLAIVVSSNAQTMKTVKLEKPDTKRGLTIMQALEKRQSTREFSTKELSLKDLSDLLWAANGFNRPDKRTAATAGTALELERG